MIISYILVTVKHILTFFVFLFASERAFALLHFMFTGCATHKSLFAYSCFNLHNYSLTNWQKKSRTK